MTAPALPDTVILDPPDAEIDRIATLSAINEWNNLPSYRQPYVRFDDLVAKHRRRIARQHERQTARSGP